MDDINAHKNVFLVSNYWQFENKFIIFVFFIIIIKNGNFMCIMSRKNTMIVIQTLFKYLQYISSYILYGLFLFDIIPLTPPILLIEDLTEVPFLIISRYIVN